MNDDRIAAAFHLQAKYCRLSGSELTATLLETLVTLLDGQTQTGAAILNWPGDPMVDALKLRIAGGFNALARSGRDPELAALYAARQGNWLNVIGRVLKEHDDWLLPWLDSPPQTNEVARAGALWPGMMAIAHRFGPRLELLELGASAGLNLNMDRFAYDLRGMKSGVADSAVRLAPEWEGNAPQQAEIAIISRRGVDLNPLDITDPAIAERMLAYIWPDQAERVARAEAAIELAHRFPPCVDRADGAEWLEAMLAEPQEAGVTRTVYHSIALQYFTPEGRARVNASMKAAGARATPERPLAWLSMEFSGEVINAELRLRRWPGGDEHLLAQCHPHGRSIRWFG